MPRRRKTNREKDLTSRYLDGEMEEDRMDAGQRFSARNKGAQQVKMERTAALRAAAEVISGDIESLPMGQVVQVYSLYYEVESAGTTYLCSARKTLGKLSETGIVVGDFVRFRVGQDEGSGFRVQGSVAKAVIELVMPRRTVLTRAESFKNRYQHPIVANADQFLIVASVLEPRIKWGLVDRTLVAASSGGLRAILCLNKIDLGEGNDKAVAALAEARDHAGHYRSLGVDVIETSAARRTGLEELRQKLTGQTTVLAGHSGVGKSSLINAMQPSLDLRVGIVSTITDKGRHTTSSARSYPLERGGIVIDTPGVKQFGLWGVTAENLLEHFPDVEDESAPPWRVESYQRIVASLA